MFHYQYSTEINTPDKNIIIWMQHRWYGVRELTADSKSTVLMPNPQLGGKAEAHISLLSILCIPHLFPS